MERSGTASESQDEKHKQKAQTLCVRMDASGISGLKGVLVQRCFEGITDEGVKKGVKEAKRGSEGVKGVTEILRESNNG